MIQAFLSGEKILSSASDAFSLYEKSRYGEKKENTLEYAPVEALYLLHEQRMQLFSGKKALDFKMLLQKLKRHDKKIETKFAVYADLRTRGYIVKTALKFGAEFRVYDKGIKPGEDHARWILFTVREHENVHWHDFAAKNRVAHATQKNLLIAIVDDEGDVSYYQVEWLKP